MDDHQAHSLSFQPILALNIPLGVQQSDPSDMNPQSNVIDLTVDDSSPLENRMIQNLVPGPVEQMEDSDDDIIYTGRNLVPNPDRGINQMNGNSITSQDNSRGAGLTGRIADLTAGIYAGYFSSNFNNPRDNNLQQGPSVIRIRDSPPLQVRRSNPAIGPRFGGGGRFSAGQFSGLITSGVNGIRDLAAGARYRLATSGETFQEMFATFNRNNQRNASPFFSINDTEQFVPLEEDNARLFAVLGYPSQISLAKKYEEHDSHPQKIGPGFSKEIVPLDREIFTLDDSPRLRAIKQDSRPICASCDRDLLICQDSTSNGRIGRRPWILNCGHVVDSECLELARTRARVAKKNGRGKARRGSVAAGRRGAKLVESPDALTTPLTSASDSKRRKTGRCQQQKSSSQSQSQSRDLSTISDCAHRRQERARAREAKKMNEKTPESTTHISTKKTTPERSEAKLDCPGEEDEEEISFVEAQNLKGKGKAQDDLMNEKMIILSPVTDKSIALTAITPKPSLRFTWTICPIVGCKGPGGDLLAAVGSKKAPWEMFV